MSNDERPDSLAAQAAAWVPPWERPRTEPDRAYQAAHRAGDEVEEPESEAPAEAPAAAGWAESGGVADGGRPDDGEEQAGEPALVERANPESVTGDGRPDDGGDRSAAGLSEEGDDFDGPFEGANPPDYRAFEPDESRLRGDPPAPGEERDDRGSSYPEPAGSERGAPKPASSELTDPGLTGSGLDGSGLDGSGLGDSGLDGSRAAPPGTVVDEPRKLAGEERPEPTDVRLGGEVSLPEPVEAAVEAGADQDGAPVDAPLPAGGDDAGDVFDLAAVDDVSDAGEIDLPFTEVVPAGNGGDAAALAVDGGALADGAAPADDGAAQADDEAGLRPGAGFGPPAGGNRTRENGDGRVAGPPGEHDQVDGFGDRAAAYAAGAADAGEALRGAAGRHATDGDDPPEAPLTTRPAAESIGDAGRAEAGSAVPVQGRRRRGDAGASGEAASRTSESGEAKSATAAGSPGGARPASEGGAAVAGSPAAGNSDADAAADSGMPALVDGAELAAALEAIMLVVDEPVAELQLAQILEQPTERIAATLDDLSARYTAAGHGFDLRRVAGGWRLYTRPEYAAYVERFVLDGQSVRLTQAALETLAVVAYKQPVTRSRISAIRGVNCDGVMRTLVTRGLIEECGIEGETGAHLYRTTALFLEKLGLNSVDQLPPLAPFLPDDVEEVLDATG